MSRTFISYRVLKFKKRRFSCWIIRCLSLAPFCLRQRLSLHAIIVLHLIFMKIGCRFSLRCVDREFIVPLSKKEKEWASGIKLFCSLCFWWGARRPMKFTMLLGLTQLRKAPRFCTIYLPSFYAISLIATLPDL